MNILVINAGSTSLKVDVFAMPEESCLASAAVQRIGKDDATLTMRRGELAATEQPLAVADHVQALRMVLDSLLGSLVIDAVGHRVVHGGEALTEPTVIDERVEQIIDHCARFAPLHNPVNLASLRAARRRLPDLPHVAVMDTGFHRTLPKEAYVYAIPYQLYERHGVRRYGFHGTSHQYVACEAARLLRRPLGELALITCHLGGGASVCAIKGGRSVDTSMGMTPLEGLVMGSRCGDLDAGIVMFLQEQLAMSPRDVENLLSRESGLLGLSGISRDMRELLKAAAAGNRRAQLAVDVFCRRVRHYIGAYLAELGGADAVVFTGGIGENAAAVRESIACGMQAFGIEVDAAANWAKATVSRCISAIGSAVGVLVIPTDEELQIARAAVRCLDDDGGGPGSGAGDRAD